MSTNVLRRTASRKPIRSPPQPPSTLELARQRLSTIEAFCWWARHDLGRADLSSKAQVALCQIIEDSWRKLGEVPRESNPGAAALILLLVDEVTKHPTVHRDVPYPAVACACEPRHCPEPGTHQICTCRNGKWCPMVGRHTGSEWVRPFELHWKIQQTYPAVAQRLAEADCESALADWRARPGKTLSGTIPKWERLAKFILKAGLGTIEPDTLRQGFNRLRERLRPTLEQVAKEYEGVLPNLSARPGPNS
jgi:hypothetical protein